MLSSKFLKDIMSEARPIIKRQLEDAQVIASFRELVTANGGDWSALKALMKAHVEDSLDDSGEGKRVKKILEKADSSNAYAGMLGLANMNENNYFPGDDDEAEETVQPDIIIDSPGIKLTVNADGGSRVVLEGNAFSPPSQPDPFIPQPTKAAGSDLTTSPGPQGGQVADIQPETANSGEAQAEGAAVGESPAIRAAVDNGAQPDGGEDVATDNAHTQDNLETRADASDLALGSDVEAVATTPMYADPGVITWESCPPEGVVQHEYSKAFGALGQDIAVIEDDLLAARAGPIVKIGNVILDGWARFTKARGMFTETLEDGVVVRRPLEYSVVQYAGHDPLLDCIKWNLEGRILSAAHKRTIADRLAKLYPQRRGIVYAAFEGAELVDA